MAKLCDTSGPALMPVNLGIKTFLNGALVSDIVLDTSAAATDTIDYVVTDPTGLTGTSTRTILIEASATPNPPSAPTATSSPDATTSLPILEAPPLVPNYPATTALPSLPVSDAISSPTVDEATSTTE
jgi:hypothetical protein